MSDWARLGGESMGTSWSVVMQCPPASDLRRLHKAIEHCLDRVIAQMSTWEPDSEISQYNRGAPGSWHRLSFEFFSVLECALDIARASDGALDPTIGRLVGLWGFGANAIPGSAGIPDAASLEAARHASGWHRLRLDAPSLSVCQPGGLHLDLSAIAKGFAADWVAMRLSELGIRNALVEVGGELVAMGTSERCAPWNILLESGDETDRVQPRVIALGQGAVATTGDLWHGERRGDRWVSHSLDPRTAEPIPAAVSAVTVVADSAMRADGWATALAVLGPSIGLQRATALNIPARFVVREGTTVTEHCTPALEPLLVDA